MKHLAVDLGSSNGKVFLVETDQKKVTFEEVHRFETPRVVINGRQCTDIYRIFTEILESMVALKKKGIAIDSIGVDSWSSDCGIIDETGELVGLPVFYRDPRNNGTVEILSEKIDHQRLFNLTTQHILKDTTLCQLLGIRRDQPHLITSGHKFMCLSDILMYFFTGRICSELSVASYTQMYDVKKDVWQKEVFDVFDLPWDIKPEVVRAGDVLGVVNERICKEYGLDPIKVVAPAVHDTASSIAAIPVSGDKKWAYICTGTWFLCGVEFEGIPDSVDMDRAFHNEYSITAMGMGKNMMKENVAAMWLIQECKKAWNKRGIDVSFDDIANAAKKAEPFYGFVDSGKSDFFMPSDMTEAICEYLDKTGQNHVDRDNIGQVARIVYESVAFMCKKSLCGLEKTVGYEFEEVYIVGGASRIGLLNEMIASASNKVLISGSSESSCLGNALLQNYGCGGVQSLEELRALVRENEPMHTFTPVEVDVWEEQYAHFLETIKK